tara:strand:+ start:360 stop:791 length:432 start_codon:yes stop_codon:yes gene_type:complete
MANPKAGYHGNYVQDLTEATSISPNDSGKVFMLNSATEFTVTLPSVADAGAGFNCKFIVKAAPDGADYAITEKASADTDVIICNGINELETDDGEDGVYSAGCTLISFKDGVAVAGDYVEFLCDGTNYYATGQTNADGGVTAT